ncbi:MAG: hypothetical protein PHV75_07750 [Victivallaceae bacterium]|nr:hypothetical protein [Victivallaceae bacterium]NLK84286.1 hypothetical protein [Lentisphaerota bacterium]MDD3115959.1 hypothetical protein [Victivallaceae bacterium]MDD3702785.1 hypothetical protein [Victivallaceae bacterium]MDD4318398.1 hypothetical protein [Victivallaceae bacterium]
MGFEEFFNRGGKRAAIFMSGSGDNARKLLETRSGAWKAEALVTDYPENSKAADIAEQFKIPLVSVPIRNFYATHGLKSISLATAEGRGVRDLWTAEIRNKLMPFQIDLGILAGFVSLCNIASDFPCLNIHPGDLTYEVDGRRYLTGLHTIPVERALLAGLPYLRSSVIAIMPYYSEADIDAGPILGVSSPVPVDNGGLSLKELRSIAEKRPTRKPVGGWGDILEKLALKHQSRLKFEGDLKVYSRVVDDYANGRFKIHNGRLYYEGSPVKTVEYSPDGTVLIP